MLFENKVSSAFADKVKQIGNRLGINPDYLMSCMGFETIYTFNPAIQNSIGATGLIQFLPSTAIGLGTTTDTLRKMTAVNQLDYVEKYFVNVIAKSGKLKTLVDVYLAIFYPAAIGKPDSYKFSDVVERANPVFDSNGDKLLTKKEVADTISKFTVQHSKGTGTPYVSFKVLFGICALGAATLVGYFVYG